MQDTQELTDVPAAEAFEVTGFQAAVRRPRFGNAHQQYFTPRWLCEALRPIAEHAFGFDDLVADDRPRLNVLDPTCGAARLLVPFKEAGHTVLGIELDGRLAEVAARAVGKRAVRPGDLVAYGTLIPEGRWQVAAINPPYGLWWPVGPDNPYCNFTHSFAAMARLCFQRCPSTNRFASMPGISARPAQLSEHFMPRGLGIRVSDSSRRPKEFRNLSRTGIHGLRINSQDRLPDLIAQALSLFEATCYSIGLVPG